MTNLAELQAAVAAEDSVIDSAVALIQGLAEQVANLPADQAAIDALAADIRAKADVLSQAVVTNTSAAKGQQNPNTNRGASSFQDSPNVDNPSNRANVDNSRAGASKKS